MAMTEIRRVVTDSGIEIAPVYRETGRRP